MHDELDPDVLEKRFSGTTETSGVLHRNVVWVSRRAPHPHQQPSKEQRRLSKGQDGSAGAAAGHLWQAVRSIPSGMESQVGGGGEGEGGGLGVVGPAEGTRVGAGGAYTVLARPVRHPEPETW